jgi:hypothetical protein
MTTKRMPVYMDAAGNLWQINPEFTHVRDVDMVDGMFMPLTLNELTEWPLIHKQIDITAGTIPIGTIPAGSLLQKCVTVATTAFDGNFSVTIGDSGTHAGILANANITKTIGAVSGEDPATCGSYLWTPGVQTTTAGDWTYTPGTLSGGDWSEIAADLGTELSHDKLPFTQTKTAASETAGSQVKTAPNFAVTTYGHPRHKWYAADTVINAYVTQTTTTVGALDVYVFYTRGVMT